MEPRIVEYSLFAVEPEDFEFVRLLGSGSFGEVWRVTEIRTGSIYALKVLDKLEIVSNKFTQATIMEKRILEHLSKVKTQFIVKLHAAFQNYRKLFFLMDLVQGDSLRSYLTSGLRLKEEEISNHLIRVELFCGHILRALLCLRLNNIIHGDIKPENIIIDEKGHPFLIDFGQSYFYIDENASHCGGSVGYMAPELILQQNHGFEIDYFSLGVIVFELFFHKRPYQSLKRPEFMKEISKKPMNIDNFPELATINQKASDFIIKLLKKKPKDRLGRTNIDELINHDWFSSSNTQAAPTPLKPNWFQISKERSNLQEAIIQQPREKSYEETEYSKNLEQGYLQQFFKDFNYMPNKDHLDMCMYSISEVGMTPTTMSWIFENDSHIIYITLFINYGETKKITRQESNYFFNFDSLQALQIKNDLIIKSDNFHSQITFNQSKKKK